MKERGFTLIEMIITLGIFAVVTGLVMVNFRVGQQGDELRIAARLMESNIRRAQTAAISGQVLDICKGGTNDLHVCPSGLNSECGGGSCERDLPRGYGIHLVPSTDPRTLVYFADTNGDRAYNNGEAIATYTVSSGQFVQVSAVSPASSGVLDIVFVPPKPTVYINGGTTDSVVTITLKHSTTGATRNVTLNRISGQVSSD